MQVRLHRTQGDPEGIGNLLIGELLHVAEGERGAVRRRKLFHRRHDLGDLFTADRGRLGTLRDLLGILGQLVDRCLVGVPALHVVEARVRRDPI